MENKEIKNNAEKLKDQDLENVNGGLMKPIILNVETGMRGRNLELSEDALNAVTGGSVSAEPAPELIQCPKCGRPYEYGSSCTHCQVSVIEAKSFLIQCSKCGRPYEYGSSCPHCRV